MYTSCCLMMIHQCAKFGMLMSKSKDNLAQTKIHGENMILILSQKVKVRTYVSHHPMVIHSYAKYGMTMSKDK